MMALLASHRVSASSANQVVQLVPRCHYLVSYNPLLLSDVNPPGVAPLTWVLGRPASPVPPGTRTRPSSLPTQAFALVGAAPSPPAHSPPGRRPPGLLLGPLGWSRGGWLLFSGGLAPKTSPCKLQLSQSNPQSPISSGTVSPRLLRPTLSNGNPFSTKNLVSGLSRNLAHLSPLMAPLRRYRS